MSNTHTNTLFGLFCLFVIAPLFGQSEVKKELGALMNNSSLSFQTITERADSIFDANDLGFASVNLDGTREKYERWKGFWENYLDESGNMVDYTQFLKPGTHSLQKSGEWCEGVEISATWDNINYNENMGLQIDHGRTSAIGFSPSDPNTFYVGSAWGGIWKTTDGGTSYINVNDRLPLAAVSGIYIDPTDEDHILVALSDIVWYGSNSIGIYETTDGGVSFHATALTHSLIQNRRIYGLTVDPANSNVIYASTSFGLLRSEDYFATYDYLLSTSMQAVQFCQNDPTVAYGTSNSGVLYKSTDSGNTFLIVGDFGSGAARMDVDPDNADKLVVTCGDQIHFSTDGGTNFTQSTMPESNCVVSLVPGTTSGIVIGNFDVHRSDDGGANFTQISHWLGNNGLPIIHVDQRNCFTNPYSPEGVYFCNDGGIFRYNPVSDDFTNLSTDLLITQYYDIAISQVEDLVIGGGSQDNGNVTRNADGTWQAYAGTGDGMEQAIHNSNPDIRFWEYQYGGMRRFDVTTGSNTNIEPDAQTINGAWHTPYLLDPNDDNRMICGYQRVYESSDLGDNWSYLGSDFANGSSLQELAIAPSNSDIVYAATSNQLWRHTGVSDWSSCATPGGSVNFGGIVVDASNPDIVYTCSGGFSGGNKVYKSIDGGQSWENISFDLPNLPITAMRLLETQYGALEDGLFVGSIGGVYFLPAGGSEWFKYGCLPHTEVSDIEIQYSTNTIFIGTHGRGIFSTVLDNFELLSIATVDSMEGVSIYPNPVINELTIDSEEMVRAVHIYDQLGRITFSNEKMLDNTIDLRSLIPGVYILKVEFANAKTSIHRFVKE